jgi:uncharacterized membrane protein
MNNTQITKVITAAGLAVAVTSAALQASAQVNVPKPTYKFEKCYGIVKAGHNDCFSPGHSCGGTSTRDRDPQSWVYMPAGTCAKIAGGALKPGG